MKFYDIEIDRTDCTVIHQEVVDHVKERMPSDDLLLDLADTCKLFSDSTRLKILYALTEAEMCVCDISVLLGMSKSSVSHQLQVLKQSNLIKYRKAGRVVYYSLADDHVKTICTMGMEHVLEED